MRRRQGRVLGLLPEWEGPAGGFFAGRRDHYFANATVRAFVDSNKPISNETTQVARQRGTLKTLEFREARGRNRAGLNQRRQQGELGASNARPSHRFLEGAGQISAPTARSRARALPAGDEVDFFTLHIACVYTFIRAVKAQSRRSIEPRCLSLVANLAGWLETPGGSPDGKPIPVTRWGRARCARDPESRSAPGLKTKPRSSVFLLQTIV